MPTIGIINGEVDASKAISETEDELVIPAIVAREAVLPYPKGKMFRPAAELQESLFTFEKAWVVTEKHPEPLVSIVTNKKEIKGCLTDVRLDADAVMPNGKKSPAVRCNVHLKKQGLSKAFLDDVKAGRRRDVSVGFTYDTEVKAGEWLGEKYDFVQRNLLINHVAVGVPVGRMRAPFIGLGCDSVDFEVEENGPLAASAAPVPLATPQIPLQKPTVTLTHTNEKTSQLINTLRKLANSKAF